MTQQLQQTIDAAWENRANLSPAQAPKEVVDASMAGEGGIREFARRWQRFVDGGDPTREWETSGTEN